MSLSPAQQALLTRAAESEGVLPSGCVWIGGIRIVWSTVKSLESRGLITVKWDGTDWFKVTLTEAGWRHGDPDGLIRLRARATAALRRLMWLSAEQWSREDCEAIIGIADRHGR